MEKEKTEFGNKPSCRIRLAENIQVEKIDFDTDRDYQELKKALLELRG